MAELIRVMSSRTDSNKVLIWETHPKHPDGEIFIVGNGKAHTVYPTPQIQGLLETHALVKVQQVSSKSDSAPMDGYDEMTVDQVLDALSDLDDEEKAAVLEYESTHKKRVTVLGALDGGDANDG